MTQSLRELYDSITAEVEKNASAGTFTGETWQRSLTFRELEIIIGLAEGMTDREIAERYGLSPLTVRSHLRRIGDVVGARRREAIVLEALRAGVIE